jgi:hypothetical protein
MLFTTENSEYEIDLDRRRCRRTRGEYHPTSRQGADGKWKDYHHITPSVPQVGSAIFIDWDGEGRGTMTSMVTRVTRDPVCTGCGQDITPGAEHTFCFDGQQ